MKNKKLLPMMVALAALSGAGQAAVTAAPPPPAQKSAVEARQAASVQWLTTIDVDGEDYLFAVRKDATGSVFAQHRSHSSHSSHSSHRSHYSSR